MRKITIPGTGWDTESVINGFIKIRRHDLLTESWETVQHFEYDDLYPFTNIFWQGSPASYKYPVIGIAGSYKQIEEDWNEWLWKFSQLLQRLDAIAAHVNLSCFLGDYHWKFEPEACFLRPSENRLSTIGQTWGITDSPVPDFSTDHEWLSYCADGKWRFDEKTGEWYSEWTQLVERWDKPETD